MQLTGSEIKHLVDAVERARFGMGRGFFWYYGLKIEAKEDEE